jgi:uncharacterized membrane protein (UPF0127 family)
MKKNKNSHKKRKFREENNSSHQFSPNRSHGHMKQVTLALITIVIIIFLGYTYHCVSEKTCRVKSLSNFFKKSIDIKAPRGSLTAEVVDTDGSRELGLSGRTGLGKKEGMLFIFDKPGRYGFWMKDMLFSIDMVWINENGLVVHVEKNVKPESYPKAFINTLDATYVLEIASGNADTYGIVVGAKLLLLQ